MGPTEASVRVLSIDRTTIINKKKRDYHIQYLNDSLNNSLFVYKYNANKGNVYERV